MWCEQTKRVPVKGTLLFSVHTFLSWCLCRWPPSLYRTRSSVWCLRKVYRFEAGIPPRPWTRPNPCSRASVQWCLPAQSRVQVPLRGCSRLWWRLFQRAKIQVIWKQFTTAKGNIGNIIKLFQRAKIQVIWKQFTTSGRLCPVALRCFKEQRYKLFESNSQQYNGNGTIEAVVSKSKDTSYLKAIHNTTSVRNESNLVVSKSKDTSYLKAIHNYIIMRDIGKKVVSKSKDTSYLKAIHNYVIFDTLTYAVVSKSKDTSYLKAIHNYSVATKYRKELFQRAKIQVIWKQFTTQHKDTINKIMLFQRAKIQVIWKQFTTYLCSQYETHPVSNRRNLLATDRRSGRWQRRHPAGSIPGTCRE